MFSSSKTLKNLKTLSIAGMLLNTLAFIVIFLMLLANPTLIDELRLWIAFFGTFSVGIPMYAILYASLKNREYLRDILHKTGGDS